MPLQARGKAAASLAGRLIGEAPPKAARDIYDGYLRSVAVLLGGETGPEEVQASAGSIWDQLAQLPAYTGAKSGHQGLVNQLKPYR